MAETTPDAPRANHDNLPVRDRTGAVHCYNCVIEQRQAQVYNLARRMLGNRDLAEDATQEALASGYGSFHQFQGRNLKAWIMQIAANVCRDMLRSKRSLPTVSLSLETLRDDGAASGVDRIPSPEESPEDRAERRELRRAIEAGLAALPPDQRLAVTLVDVQGRTYEESAGILGCPPGTVKSRLNRGRRRIRERLRNEAGLLPRRYRQNPRDDADRAAGQTATTD